MKLIVAIWTLFLWGSSTTSVVKVAAQVTNPFFSGAHIKLADATGTPDGAFGGAISKSGNTMAIGFPDDDYGTVTDSGSVLIYVQSALTGVWSKQLKLVSTDPADFLEFGFSVALAGDILAVGTPGDNTGSATLFWRLPDNQWYIKAEQPKLMPAAADDANEYGWSMVMDDSHVLVIGAGNIEGNAGTAYIYLISSSTGLFVLHNKLTKTSDLFSSALAISGSFLAVGAYSDNTKANNAGAVYMYSRKTNGNWSQDQGITATDGIVGDSFGWSVALVNNNTLAIGSINAQVSGVGGAGAVYMYTRAGSGTTWAFDEKVTASNKASGDGFGSALALSDNYLAVGAPNRASQTGAVYLYQNVANTWTYVTQLANDTVPGDLFGTTVVLDASDLVIAATGAQVNSQTIGSVWVYPRGASTVPTMSPTKGSPCRPSASCGTNKYWLHKASTTLDNNGVPISCDAACTGQALIGLKKARGYTCGPCSTVYASQCDSA